MATDIFLFLNPLVISIEYGAKEISMLGSIFQEKFPDWNGGHWDVFLKIIKSSWTGIILPNFY